MSTNKHIQTPSQTVGPFFAYGLTAEDDGYHYPQIVNGNMVRGSDVEGERIRIMGKVFDGGGKVIPDVMIEIWQADANGYYHHELSSGFGRTGTSSSEDGSFIFETIKPGSVDGAAPHINVIVFMRGLLVHAFTRIYFSDETELNANDEVLNTVPSSRKGTLIAQRNIMQGKVEYQFDIYMQGKNETVFFDV